MGYNIVQLALKNMVNYLYMAHIMDKLDNKVSMQESMKVRQFDKEEQLVKHMHEVKQQNLVELFYLVRNTSIIKLQYFYNINCFRFTIIFDKIIINSNIIKFHLKIIIIY